MKTLLVLIFSIICIASIGNAQTWVYDSDFVAGASPHGVIVDGNGLIWVGFYRYSDTLGMPQDTIPVAPIWVYNPDGTEASFSPIRTFEVDGVLDTMDSYCRGLSLDNDGNVLFVGNQILIRFNYQTGEAMNSYLFPTAGSLASAACDDNGYIYLTRVSSGQPLQILDSDFELYSEVTDAVPCLQRSTLVSGDGNDVYVSAIYSGPNGVRKFTSDDGSGPDGTYTLTDTIGTVFGETRDVVKHNMWAQVIDWDNNGLMWVGTYWDVAVADFSGWYALDPTQNWAIVDTLGHNFDTVLGDGAVNLDDPPTPGTYISPRHIAFTADGQTAYCADFDGGLVTKWTNADPKGPGSTPIGLDQLVSIRYKDGRPQIAVDFDLQQNYPNPFNPTTKIPFDITEAVDVKLVIYDVNGRQVTTLVNDRLMPQHYEYEFDASNLASGTYFYQLDVNGIKITKQMLLIK